ncbi:MAG: threonine synthase [Candidatus Marinimicrobia bacterium]|nr:threonine synthase [Candidatus Neomarinimicrobiota bacterium]
MKYYSTNHKVDPVDLRSAVLQGFPGDRGLYMPEDIPLMPPRFFEHIHTLNFREIATAVALTLLGEDLEPNVIIPIVDETLSFNTPLVKLDDTHYVLELFHGPTLAFKDVGARFMARLMGYFMRGEDARCTVLVATSGDTGSAVANGFYGVEGIDVVLLYPSGRISPIQEQQLTTLGGNITALEIEGTFDDCQDLVKAAFVDKTLSETLMLTSANSINIARLIPQSFYYFNAYAQLKSRGVEETPVFSVPSGNLGNLTAGLIAKRMGLPVKRFIAACNGNDSLPRYLRNGHYAPQPTKHTISNAMDVGNPSNFARIEDLYGYAHGFLSQDLTGWSFSDDETRAMMKTVYERYRYIADPHGAVGMCGTQRYHDEVNGNDVCITAETAHPAKFGDVVHAVLGIRPDMPERLASVLDKAKHSVKLPADLSLFRQFLLERKP